MKIVIWLVMGVLLFFTLKHLVGKQPIAGSRFFYRSNNVVYCKECHSTGVLSMEILYAQLVGADPRSFRVLGDQGYAKDKNNVYYRSDVIKNADVESFQPLILASGKASDHFFVDRCHVFADGDIVKDANPRSFHQFVKDAHPYTHWYSDDQHVYWTNEWSVTDRIRHKRWEYKLFERLLGYDSDFGPFYGTGLVSSCNAREFAPLDEYYASDSRHIYYASGVVRDADVATFRLLTIGDFTIAADEHHVYNQGGLVFLQRADGSYELASEQYLLHLLPDTAIRCSCFYNPDVQKQFNIPTGKFSAGKYSMPETSYLLEVFNGVPSHTFHASDQSLN